ncbi:MAG: energy transducer TonB, partial [Candidatus Cloacimonetes bacterium]|nr:energy transducer TonB [Candidatus Cloacimonadota bacterium]
LILLLIKYIPPVIENKFDIVEFGWAEDIISQRVFSTPFTGYPAWQSGDLIGADSNLLPRKVDLPKVTSDNPERLLMPAEENQAFNQVNLNQQLGIQERINNLDDFPAAIAIDAVTDKPALADMDEYLNNLNALVQSRYSGEEPFILEGEILSRNIEKKILPVYPVSIEKNIDLKIRFEVLPEGKVINIMVVKKADPILEQASIDALSQWQFSPISSEAVQVGFVTFIFQLK